MLGAATESETTSPPLGRGLAQDARGRALAGFAACALAGVDLALAHYSPGRWPLRLIAPLIALLVVGQRLDWRPQRLGLRSKLHPSGLVWLKRVGLIGAAVGVVCVGFGLLLPEQVQQQAFFWSHMRDDLSGFLLETCVVWPLVEETIHRLAICLLLFVALGKWRAIVLNGALFTLLHIVYGNPGPDNAVAGFFLAWTYIESRSIVLPLLLHGFGNLIVVGTLEVLAHYFGYI